MPDDQKPSGDAPPESSQPPEGTPSDSSKAAAGGGTPPGKPPEKAPPPSAAAQEKPAGAGAEPAAKAAPDAAKAPPPKPAAKKPEVMAVSPWEGPLVDRLKERFGEQITEFSSYQGQDFLVAKLPAAVPILEHLKLQEGFDYLVDVTAVHYPKREKPFDVVWVLYSFPHNVRMRVKAEAGEGDSPGSASELHATANWLEREVFDMFGITFEGHPHMTRILLPDEWQGHPLRKDYSIIQQDQDWVRENLKIESGQ